MEIGEALESQIMDSMGNFVRYPIRRLAFASTDRSIFYYAFKSIRELVNDSILNIVNSIDGDR